MGARRGAVYALGPGGEVNPFPGGTPVRGGDAVLSAEGRPSCMPKLSKVVRVC